MRRLLYADVGRAGLANSLLPLARAVVMREKTAIPLLAPVWLRLRIGPLLRRERDRRSYWTFMRAAAIDIRGPRRIVALVGWQRIDEARAQAELERYGEVRSQGMVVFRGLGDFFRPLRGYSNEIRRSIVERVRDGFLTARRPRPRSYVAIHVRRGDFPTFPDRVTPVEWFVERVSALRTEAGKNGVPFRAVVVSDGDISELGALLAGADVELWRGRSAIDDLLLLADASLVVGSGDSTFSMFGAFLGQSALIMPPRGLTHTVFEDPDREFELGIGTVLPETVRSRLAGHA